MVPAADNSFKYKVSSKGGLKGGKTTAVKKVGIYDPKHKGKGGKWVQELVGQLASINVYSGKNAVVVYNIIIYSFKTVIT